MRSALFLGLAMIAACLDKVPFNPEEVGDVLVGLLVVFFIMDLYELFRPHK